MAADYLPEWLSDFAIAKKIGVPVTDLENISVRWYDRAVLLLQAEHEAEAMRREQGGK